MFNKGKSNQRSSERIGWNESFGRFLDPIVERIPCVCGKYSEKEFDVASEPLSASHFTESLWNNTLKLV